jgi:hypothetical protein
MPNNPFQLVDLRQYTRLLLGETDPTNSFWADADLNNFINRGYEDVVTSGELLQSSSKMSSIAATAATMPDAAIYPIPVSVLMLTRIFYFDPVQNQWTLLQPKTELELDKQSSGWFTTLVASPTAIPTNWVVRGMNYHLYPAPITAGANNILLWYVVAPTPLVNDTDVLAIPQGYQELVCIGGAIRALESDRQNPDNKGLLQVLRQDFGRMMTDARKKDRLKPKQYPRLVDVRDFQLYPSQWRWPQGA